MDDKLTHIIQTNHALHYGLDGKSAYEIALEHGYVGTEQEYVEKPVIAANKANKAADKANDFIKHPPVIIEVNEVKYWAIWDADKDEYILSDSRAEGDPGPKGDPGEAGPAGPEGPVGPKGDTPEITADEQGNIYSDGELVTSVVAKAATKANTAAERAGDATPVIEEIDGDTVTIDIQPNHIYKCGELSSLKIQSVVDSVQIAEVIFTSGATATELALPDTLSGVTGWLIPQVNKTYKIFFQSNTATISD